MLELNNWAGNLRYRATSLHTPTSLDELRLIVRASPKIRPLGTRHSFNSIADSEHELVSLSQMPKQVEIDSSRQVVSVGGGVRYGDLCVELHRQGLALHNLASLPHISVAGACATATHGSGDCNGNLATAVSAMEIVTAVGDLAQIAGDEIHGTAVHLGALGVVNRLELNVGPTYAMRQVVYENLAMGELIANFDAITSSAYSVSLFTDWRAANMDQVWIKEKLSPGEESEPPADLFGAVRASGPMHPLAAMSADNCTEQMAIAGPWHARLPHFRMEFTPSSGDEVQSEYLVPRENAIAALQAIYALREKVALLLQVSEIRTVAADTMWMSPCYKRNCVAFHFTWQNDWGGVSALLPELESAIADFEARPHWGKLFTSSPAKMGRLYPRITDFRKLAHRYDPSGKFRNAFLNRYVFGEGTPG
jgi:xylitol oxidase